MNFAALSVLSPAIYFLLTVCSIAFCGYLFSHPGLLKEHCLLLEICLGWSKILSPCRILCKKLFSRRLALQGLNQLAFSAWMIGNNSKYLGRSMVNYASACTLLSLLLCHLHPSNLFFIHFFCCLLLCPFLLFYLF